MAAVAKVDASALAKLSEASQYEDEPPKLCAALNDTRTDAGDGASFDDDTGFPIEDKAAPPFDGKTIASILVHVAKRLTSGLDDAWQSQKSCETKWTVSGSEHEWAKTIAELFLGLTYSGPADLYHLGPPVIPLGRFNAFQPTAAGETWETFMFHRICRAHPVQCFRLDKGRAHGALYARSWDDPTPIPSSEPSDDPSDEGSIWDELEPLPDEPEPQRQWVWHHNDDPAVPIGVACQHMTTWGVLSRGIPLEWMGNASNPGSGLMASDACARMPIFGVMDSPGGKSPFGGSAVLPQVQAPKAPGKWIESSKLDISDALANGLAPGTIVVLDPDSGTGRKSVTLWLSEYEKQGHVVRSVLKDYFYTRTKVGGADLAGEWESPGRAVPVKAYQATIDAQLARTNAAIKRLESEVPKAQEQLDHAQPQDQWKAKDRLRNKTAELEAARRQKTWLEAQRELAGNTAKTEVPYNFNQQLPGSHIYFALRVHKDKTAWQAFDVSIQGGLASLKKTQSDTIIARQGDGHLDGYKLTGIAPGDGRQLAGIGILPRSENLAEQVEFLKRARPVGLARLVVTKRPGAVKGQTILDEQYSITTDSVLYISRLLRMYGPGKSDNFPISKLLWSLRNTPGFTNLQCWWFVFAPQGLLAKCMWAEGAREMTLRRFVDEYASSDDLRYLAFFQPSYSPIGEAKQIPPATAKATAKPALNVYAHYVPTAILTNEGDKHNAGRVSFYCRFNTGEGTVPNRGTKFDPPPVLLPLIRATPFDDIYLHDKLKPYRNEIIAAEPDFFTDFARSSGNTT